MSAISVNLSTDTETDLGMESMIQCAVDEYRNEDYPKIQQMVKDWKTTKSFEFKYSVSRGKFVSNCSTCSFLKLGTCT